MNILDEVLQVLSENGIPHKEDGFASIPAKHCFVVWGNPESVADGADDYAMYWDHTIVLMLYFKERRTDEDKALEKSIEEILRSAGKFTRKRGYNSEYEADATSYSFDVTTDFEEGNLNGTA